MPTVWLSSWEMECCGEPFVVGGYVEWPVHMVDRSDWLERLFSATRVVVDYSYDGHTSADGQPIKIRGRVERIDAVTSEVTRTPVDVHGDRVDIVEGGARRRQVRSVSRRSPPAGPDELFVGYLVDLT